MSSSIARRHSEPYFEILEKRTGFAYRLEKPLWGTNLMIWGWNFKIFKERELLDCFNQYFIGCILIMWQMHMFQRRWPEGANALILDTMMGRFNLLNIQSYTQSMNIMWSILLTIKVINNLCIISTEQQIYLRNYKSFITFTIKWSTELSMPCN